MCKSLTCIILGVINIVWLIGGLILLILGALMRWNRQLFRQLCQHAMKFVDEKLSEEMRHTADMAIERIQEFAAPYGLIIFIGGAVICAIAAFAFVGLCCHIKLFMIVYAILVGIIFVAHAIVLIIYFCNKGLILKVAYSTLKDAVNNYESVMKGDFYGALLLVVQQSFSCCGFESANDYIVTGRFSKTDKLGNMTFTDLYLPVICCNLGMDLGEESAYCPGTFNPQNSFIEFGCKEKLEKKFFDLIALGSIAVLILTFLVLILAVFNIMSS